MAGLDVARTLRACLDGKPRNRLMNRRKVTAQSVIEDARRLWDSGRAELLSGEVANG